MVQETIPCSFCTKKNIRYLHICKPLDLNPCQVPNCLGGFCLDCFNELQSIEYPGNFKPFLQCINCCCADFLDVINGTFGRVKFLGLTADNEQDKTVFADSATELIGDISPCEWLDLVKCQHPDFPRYLDVMTAVHMQLQALCHSNYWSSAASNGPIDPDNVEPCFKIWSSNKYDEWLKFY